MNEPKNPEEAEARRLEVMEEVDGLSTQIRTTQARIGPRKTPEQIQSLAGLFRRRDALLSEARRLKSYLHTHHTNAVRSENLALAGEIGPLRALRDRLRAFVQTGTDWPSVLEALAATEKRGAHEDQNSDRNSTLDDRVLDDTER